MNSDCSTNALSNLSKYTQSDNTLRNEANRRQIDNHHSQFKNQLVVDHNLNQEFNKFSGSGGNEFASNFMEHIKQQKIHMNDQRQRENGWVQNFSQLSLNQNPALVENKTQQQFNQLQKNGNSWHEQFIQQSHHQNSILNPSEQRHQFTPNYNQDFRLMNRNMGEVYNNNTHKHVNLTEHQEVHMLEEEQKLFDNHFNMIEQELNEQSIQEEPIYNDTDKNEFAKTAKQVQNTMANSHTSTETSTKFQNSNFLKLMTAIGNREVELEGNKLVNTSNGEDIRQYLSDPLKDLKDSDPDETVMNYESSIPTNSNSNTGNNSNNRPNVSHLPDPLAHLKDGDLANISEPLQAARIISGNQVQPRDWMESFESLSRPQINRSILTPEQQEQYDDYRHDDH